MKRLSSLTNRYRSSSPFSQGLRDGIPIGMGYYAVAFSLGIIARTLNISPALGFVSSFLTRASAGEYGAYTTMAAQATALEVIGMAIVANLRYLLMSTSITQKFPRHTPLWKRILTGYCMTDEVFAISVAYPGKLPPSYSIGATLVAGTCWALGTASGIIAGNILPSIIVSALSVALFGMFIAIIVPPAKQDRAIALVILDSFVLSGTCSTFSWFNALGSGTRTILLTFVIATIAALVKPIQNTDLHDGDL